MIHVSEQGLDTNSGSQERPVRSLSQAFKLSQGPRIHIKIHSGFHSHLEIAFETQVCDVCILEGSLEGSVLDSISLKKVNRLEISNCKVTQFNLEDIQDLHFNTVIFQHQQMQITSQRCHLKMENCRVCSDFIFDLNGEMGIHLRRVELESHTHHFYLNAGPYIFSVVNSSLEGPLLFNNACSVEVKHMGCIINEPLVEGDYVDVDNQNTLTSSPTPPVVSNLEVISDDYSTYRIHPQSRNILVRGRKPLEVTLPDLREGLEINIAARAPVIIKGRHYFGSLRLWSLNNEWVIEAPGVIVTVSGDHKIKSEYASPV